MTNRGTKVWSASMLVVALCLAGASAGLTQKADPEDVCGFDKRGEHCGPGNDRQTKGGGEKVSHKGWPKISGIFWIVNDSRNHTRIGGPDNDELLGHHGSDHIEGKGGRDIIWGDWDPKNNNERQRDTLLGGTGNDFIYPSHGTTKVEGGPGNDYVWAKFGRGTIDCGPGSKDRARVHLNGPFKVRRCETVGHFCGFGADGHGGCLKPGEKRASRSNRRFAALGRARPAP
jgi:hemolysin type calcium-binding protein